MTREAKKVVSQGVAGPKREEAGSSNTFEGKVAQHYWRQLAKDAGLTCDGTACEADSLKAASRIRVTAKTGDRKVATGIEALDRNAEFTECCN